MAKMFSFSKVTLLGKISSPLEFKTSARGVVLISFSVAHLRWAGDDNGKYKEVHDHIRVIFYENLAEALHNYGMINMTICVNGWLRQRKINDANGNFVKSEMEIRGENFVFPDMEFAPPHRDVRGDDWQERENAEFEGFNYPVEEGQ